MSASPPTPAPVPAPLDVAEFARLRAIAEAATSGPWHVGPGDASEVYPDTFACRVAETDAFGSFVATTTYGGEPDTRPMQDAAFIAAANPAVVLSLLADRDRLAAEVGALREALHHTQRVAEMSAEIMRDPQRTGRWEGARRVADAFRRIADRARAALARGGEGL